MGFGTGFITGLATSFDKAVQLDIKRNQDRLSRAEEYMMQRRMQEGERLEKEERELTKNLKELSALTGSNRRAAMAAEGVGGTSEAIAELVTKIKANQELMGKDWKMEDYISFEGEEALGNDPMGLTDLVSRFGPRYAKPTAPEFKPTGIVGALARKQDYDVGALAEQTIPIDERFTRERDETITIPKAKINYGAGAKAMKFAKEMEDKWGSFDAAFLDIEMQMQSATGNELASLQKKQKSLIDLKNKIDKNEAAATAKTTKAFNPETISASIKNTYDRFLKPYYETDIDGKITKQLEGTEGQSFQAKSNAIDALSNRFTDDEGYIHPQIKRTLQNERSQLKDEVNNYKLSKARSFVEDPSTEKYVQVQSKDAAVQDAMANKYAPGTVIEYKDANNVTRMLVWTGKGFM